MKSKVELFGKLSRITFEMLFVMLLTIFIENVVLKQEPGALNRVILVFLYLASFVVRNMARMRIFGLITHVIMGAILFAIPIDDVSRWMLVVLCCYLMFSTMNYIGLRDKLKSIDEPPWPTFFVIVIMYLFGLYTKSYAFINWTYVYSLLLMIVYYLMTYLDGLKSYIDSAKEVEETHLRRVISRNNVIVFWIIVLLVVCMVIGCLLNYSKIEAILKLLGTNLLKLVGSVLMIFAILFDRIIRGGSGKSDAFNQDTMDSLKGQAKTAFDSSIIFLYIACALIIIIILIRLLKLAIKHLFARNRHQDDVVEMAESVSYIAEETPQKKIFKKTTPEEKFRKRYKKYIENFKYDIRLSNTKTCRDIADEISAEQLGDVNDITEVYAQVRYGNTKVDGKLLRRFNALFKK